MHVGKTLFAQLMEFLPWSTFQRIVARYRAIIAFGRCAVPNSSDAWPSRS